MLPSDPPKTGPDTFEIETEVGLRKLEFDPDVFRARDLRILVDGRRIAALPYPQPASPYHEVVFELDRHPLIGVTWLPAESWALGLPLRFDVFADGRSLTDGSSLADVRLGARAPGQPYPPSFYIFDWTLRIAPSAAGPGIAVGVARSADELGWQRTIILFAILLGAIGSGSGPGWRVWRHIRSDERQTVRHRAALGWAALLACYAVTTVLVIAIIGSLRA